MARYANDLKPSGTVDEAMAQIEQYLSSEGFSLTSYQGEEGVYKKGLGIMLGPQFLKVEKRESDIHLEAWIKFALFPGVYIGEMGIDGVFAVIPKKKLAGRVKAIEAMFPSS